MRSRDNESVFHNVDWRTIALYLIIVIFGWINLYAATYVETEANIFDLDTQHGKQLLWMGVSFLLGIFILVIDSHFFSMISYLLYILVLLLLLVTLSMSAVNGATSWIPIGPFKLQPSEFAKFATALALARYLGNIDINLQNKKTKFWVLCIIAIPAALIFLQHDAGSALVFASFLIPLYRIGMSEKIILIAFALAVIFIVSLLLKPYVVILILLGIALAYLFLWLNKRTTKIVLRVVGLFVACCAVVLSTNFIFNNFLEQHQQNRINVLLGKIDDPQGIDYNVRQSKIAIGSGEFLGKGFLHGTQTKFDFVPEQETDFIFCTVGEEWGFVGSLGVVLCYTLLFIRIIKLAERQKSRFAVIYGYSVASILFLHFVINIGMVLGLTPVIGVPLPFFSYGGSSLIAFTSLLFVFLRQDTSRNVMI